MKGNQTTIYIGVALGLAFGAVPLPVAAQETGTSTGSGTTQGGDAMQPMPMSPGIMMPSMDPASGRKLFAAKGCVVCHAVNGIGGQDASALDVTTMPGMTNPFDFVANMWRGAPAMIELQQEELGEQIEFTGQELADIIAFLHNQGEQKKFSDADIPPKIKKLMAHMGQEEGEQMEQMEMDDAEGEGESGN